MIRTMICSANHQIRQELHRDEIGAVLISDDNLLWLDVEAPGADEIGILAEEFGLHQLAVEDLLKQHQRPKIDVYDNFYFVVFYDIDYDETNDLIDEHEMAVIVGRNFLITVHQDPIEEIAEVATRFRRNVREIERGVGVLLYSLLDTIVDHYFPVIDRIGERIEELETRVFERDSAGAQAGMQDIFVLKRELITLRRTIAPERDAMAVLARRELPIVSEATGVYFQDLYEHVLRVTDAVDVYRDLLSGVLDSYLSVNSNSLAIAANNLNTVMKTLTSYSIILMSVTLIAGIYGMNFENMPELRTRYGYFFALGAMVLVAALLVRFFKRKGYL
jgi:magnesium transporter